MNDDAKRHLFSSNHDSDPRNGQHPSVEQLSEYLDGAAEFDEAERSAIEGHLTSCQACQAVLDDLRLVVQSLAALPVREAPRSYAITHDMLEPATTPAAPQPVVLQESRQWHARHAGKVRWATAVAAMLFVFVISADLVTNGIRPTVTGTDDSASDMTMSQPASDADESEESISALAFDEPDPIPTAATGEGAVPESEEMPMEESAEVPESDAPPPAGGEEEAEEEEAVPESAEEPASDDTEQEDATERSSEDSAGGEDNEDVSMFSVDEEAISDEPASENAATGEDSSQLGWRVAEVTLALVLALLLAVMIGLPKQRGTRRG